MNEAAIKEKLIELRQVITALPKEGLKCTDADGVYLSDEVNKAKLSIEDCVDQLRVQIRYLAFDLEATRRENQYLRKMLENRRGPKWNESSDGMSDM